MSDNLKVQNFKIIIVEIFFFTFVISFVKYRFETIQGVFYALLRQGRPIFSALSKPRSLSLVFGYKDNPKFFRKKIRNKKINFLVYGKTAITQFLYM